MAVSTPDRQRLRLDVEGMTCASCAARIERKLNRLDGVDATVNYATEEAAVSFDAAAVSVDDLIATVEAIGYRAALPSDVVEAPDAARAVRARLTVAAVLTAPLVLLTVVPPLRVEGWEWLALALATPVVFWCGAGFHRATLLNARHGAATMDTLISVGTLAAWTWSAVVLVGGIDAHIVLRGRGRDHHAHPPRPLARAARARPLERGHPRPAPARRERGARPPRRRRGARPGRRARGRRPVRGPAGREDRDRRHRRGGALRDRPVDAHRRARARRGRPRRRGRRRDDQQLGPSRRARDQGRRGYGAGADRAARHRGADGEGADPAARRPRRRRLRPGRARDRAGNACRLAPRRPGTSRPRSPPPSPC